MKGKNRRKKYEPLRSRRGGGTQTLVVQPLRKPLFCMFVFKLFKKGKRKTFIPNVTVFFVFIEYTENYPKKQVFQRTERGLQCTNSQSVSDKNLVLNLYQLTPLIS